MKIILAATAALLAVGATAASAQEWRRDRYPYEQRHHDVCQQKAHRLHDYERRAARDGRIDHREREVIRALERDLDATCGRYRYHG